MVLVARRHHHHHHLCPEASGRQADQPWLLLAESEKGLKAAFNVTTKESEVRDVGGMKRCGWWSRARHRRGHRRQGSVPTIQHWVAVPRAQGDILIFLLITTSATTRSPARS